MMNKFHMLLYLMDNTMNDNHKEDVEYKHDYDYDMFYHSNSKNKESLLNN
jgi:hypothetical protein